MSLASTVNELTKEIKELSIYKNALNQGTNIIIIDQLGMILHVNDVFCRTFKYNPEELAGKSLSIFNSGQHSNQFWDEIFAIVSNGKNWGGIIKVETKDHILLWLETSIVPCLDEKGRPYQYLATCYDMAGYREVESDMHERKTVINDHIKERINELENREKYFKALIENCSEAVVLINEQGNIIYQSPAADKISGYSDGENFGRSATEFIHPDDLADFKGLMQKLAQEPGNSFIKQYRGKNKSGHYIWLEGTISNRLHDENIKAFIANYRDITKHKEAEEKLRTSEMFLKESQTIATLGTYTLDISTNIWTSSEILDVIFGIDPAFDKTFEGWTSIIHPEWQKLMNDYFMHEVIGTKTNFDKEYKIIRQNDKAERWMHGMGRLKFNENNEPLALVGTVTDITERKLAETDRQKNEENLMQAELIAKFGYWKLSLDSMTTYASQGARAIYGTTKAILPADEVRSFRLPEYHAGMDEALIALVEENKPFEAEFKIKRKSDGAIADVFSTAVYDAETRTVFGILQDITERKKAELKALQLTQATEQSPASVVITDLNGCIEYVNPRFTEVTGYTKEEVLGKNPRVLKSEHTTFEEYENLWREISEGREWRGEFHNKKKNGDLYWEFALIAPIKNEKGEVINYIAIKEDITNIKQAEKDLQESQKKHHVFFHSNPTPIWMVHIPSYNIVDVNEAAIEHYGYTREEFLRLNARDLRPKEELERFEKQVVGQERPGKFIGGKWKHLKKNGDIIIVEITSHDMRYDNEHLRVVHANDVTQQVKAEEELKEAEMHLFSIVENSADGIALMNDQHQVTYRAPNSTALLGYEPEELTGGIPLHLIHPDDRETLLETYASVLRNPANKASFRYRFLHKNGYYKWFEGTYTNLMDDENINAIIYNYHDISEHKKGEHELKTAHDNIQLLLDSIAEGAYGVDTNGICTFVNKSFLQLTGYQNANEFIGRPIHPIIHHSRADGKNYPARECKMLNSRLTKQHILVSDEVFWRKDGSAFPVEYRSYPIIVEGKTIGAICTFNDITERKLAEETITAMNSNLEIRINERTKELLDANTALEAFSYSASHDLRAPLRAIKGFTEIISREYAPAFEPKLNEMFSYIESASKRMDAIIQDLFALAKYGNEKMHEGEVDMHKLFSKVCNNLMLTSPHKATIELEVLPKVQADASMLEQVIINLLANAIKYSSKKENPQIKVGFEKCSDSIIFYIKDNGAGFDMQHYDRLFGAFQRLHGTSEFEGTGVGLTLVKRIVEKHGGRVWADSKVNEGATFYFTIPLV